MRRMRKLAINGVGITPFRAKYLDKTYFELAKFIFGIE